MCGANQTINERIRSWYAMGRLVSGKYASTEIFITGLTVMLRENTAASSTLQCICSVLFGSDGNGLSSKQVAGLLQ